MFSISNDKINLHVWSHFFLFFYVNGMVGAETGHAQLASQNRVLVSLCFLQ